MPGIDYSKWDKLTDSCSSTSDTDSEGYRDEKENHGSGRAPQVTRLEYPSRVILGPNGVQLEQVPPQASASPFRGTSAAPQETHDGSVAAATCQINGAPPYAQPHTGAQQNNSHPADNRSGRQDDEQERMDATDDDEDLLYESLARNGGREGFHHWWTQTEDTVTVSFLVPWETKGKWVTKFRLYEAPSETAPESELHQAHLEIAIQAPPARPMSASGGPPAPPAPHLIHEVFRYPVKLSEDLIEGCWQLHFLPKRHLRLLVVQLFKEPVGLGMTLWWDRCFVTDTTSVIADTQTIPDRKRRMEAMPALKGTVAQFRNVWEEAHEEFRRRMQQRKRDMGD
ncbi:hypothetical protein, conserved [Leishmania tarentolae]|uniref:Uncharacterized protein n=1 Tax=Leishmania tarentolae TaxID=5689 RepID=A0A640KTS1_LEITA|nr:hypothetical protein, conserved [Leishmania tarentolae]